MNWNDAAEELLNQILAQSPRPTRDETETAIRELAEQIASEEGISRVGVNTVVAAWIQHTPEILRDDLPRRMTSMGLDPDEYSRLLS